MKTMKSFTLETLSCVIGAVGLLISYTAFILMKFDDLDVVMGTLIMVVGATPLVLWLLGEDSL